MRPSVTLIVLTLFLIQRSRAESEDEERRRIVSRVLDEGQSTTLTCPHGQVLRIKTAQYRIMDNTVCPEGVSTCKNKCRGNTVTQALTKRCELKSSCPIKARPASQRDDCSKKPEPLCILYTCDTEEQAKNPGNPAEDFMAILQSPLCNFKRTRRFCEY